MLDIPCIIFAGGKSSRMGTDKALLPFGDFATLTEYQLNKLQKIFRNVYISCKEKTKFDFQANFIEDTHKNTLYAPTAGFIASFEHLQTEKIFVLSVDTPFIDENIINTLISKDKKNCDATVAAYKNKPQPMCGIYHKSLLEKFTTMLHTNNHKLALLLQESDTYYVELEDAKTFLNLNHPQEYQKALELI